MARTLIRAIVLSVVLGAVFPLLFAAVFGYSVHYRTPMDPAAFYSLSYEGQQQWLRENEVRVTGLEYMKENIADPVFWKESLPFAGYTGGLLLVACLIMAWWERSATRSEPARNQNAPDDAAL